MKKDSNHSCLNGPDLTAKSRTKWKKEHKELFFDTLDANAVFFYLDNRLTELASSDLQGIDQQKIDSLVFDWNKFMLDAASSSGMFVNNKQTRKTMKRLKSLGLLLTVILNAGTTLKPEIFTVAYVVLKTDRI